MMRFPEQEQLNLPIPYSKCLAKTYLCSSGKTVAGRTVLEHCLIVSEIARGLINRLPGSVSALYPKGAELIAGSHDVGKVSPTFQKKIFDNIDDNLHSIYYPVLERISSQIERNWGGHAGTGQISLADMNVGKYIPEIVGQHHGYSPPVRGSSAEGEAFGGKPWQQERMQLIKNLANYLQVDWPVIKSPVQARLIAGLTSVADWIGSGDFFEEPAKNWHDRISRSIDNAGFVPPLVKQGLSFRAVFQSNDSKGFTPYPIQSSLIEAVSTPGLYVLEAPMGHGKTEAALYVAYQMLSTKQATGIYFALPTQLTSNKIYDRFNVFLKNILKPECIHRKALLLHGNAWILEQTEMGEEGRPGGTWFNTSKRGLLAPFAVGTIDQALMAVMNVKHGFVRAFGLAGKVVILDEVHTYDFYTGTILYALVEFLKALNCTVIILSATLSQERRQQMTQQKVSETGYPLITAVGSDSSCREIPVKPPKSHPVKIRTVHKESIAIEEALKRADTGQQVLWIENSVADAQDCYLSLAARGAESGIECGLLHSRYTATHRQDKENYWVNQFGKPGWKSRNQKGRILVGTQVLEQSLDIDGDFLITRFCPTDMTLQRIGRLWRNDNTPRNGLAEREAWLLIPDPNAIEADPGKAFGINSLIYDTYILCRSFEVWCHIDEINIPRDIRRLVEESYCTRKESGIMARLLAEFNSGNRNKKGRMSLEQLARMTLSKGAKTLPESKAQTRYSETDTLEVLLLSHMSPDPDNQATNLKLLDGEQIIIPWHRHRLTKKDWRSMSIKLMNQMVHVKPNHAPLPLQKDTLLKTGLGNCLYLGNPVFDEALLRVATVDDAGNLCGYQGAPLHEKLRIQYRRDLGYRTIQI
jgi:CRISPR-associated endonuclease/helicase Cas3